MMQICFFLQMMQKFFSIERKVKTSICIAHNVIYTSNALSSLNWAARPLRPQPTACTHRLRAVARSPATGSQQQSGLHLRNPSLMVYYSFNRPRRDGRLSWPCWLTDRGRFTHKVVTRPAISLAQDRESLPVRTGGLTTTLRHQHNNIAAVSTLQCKLDKKAQLSLTNPHDACETFARFT